MRERRSAALVGNECKSFRRQLKLCGKRRVLFLGLKNSFAFHALTCRVGHRCIHRQIDIARVSNTTAELMGYVFVGDGSDVCRPRKFRGFHPRNYGDSGYRSYMHHPAFTPP